jgi:hypothetical protein
MGGEVLLQGFPEGDGQLAAHQRRFLHGSLGLALREPLERGASRRRIVARRGREEHALGVGLQFLLLAVPDADEERPERYDGRDIVPADLPGGDLVLQPLDAVLQVHMTDLVAQDRGQLGLGAQEIDHPLRHIDAAAGDREGVDLG